MCVCVRCAYGVNNVFEWKGSESEQENRARNKKNIREKFGYSSVLNTSSNVLYLGKYESDLNIIRT